MKTTTSCAAIASLSRVACALVLAMSVSFAWAQASQVTEFAERNPFAGFTKVAPSIYAEPAANVEILGTRIDAETSEVARFALSPSVPVVVELYLGPISGTYRLKESRTGRSLLEIHGRHVDQGLWYFPGNGLAYFNSPHTELCGPRHTQKFVLRGNRLEEVQQPLQYLGFRSYVLRATPLYSTPSGGNVIAVAPAGAKVVVLGFKPPLTEQESSYLVSTEFGLTGWHVQRHRPNDGVLSIYNCN